MRQVFVGWDVGAWNCDKGPSRDAITVLEGSSLEELRLACDPRRSNLSAALKASKSPLDLLGSADAFRETAGVIAIDTPLGWPRAFVALLGEGFVPPPFEHAVLENPFVFRLAERHLVRRGLFPGGRTPLSAVRDMIGSQSTKGLHFLRQHRMRQSPPAVWQCKNCVAIETYPTPVRTSARLRQYFARLSSDPRFTRAAAAGKNAILDLQDSLWCALVAAMWSLDPTSLLAPPDDEAITTEGWIWVPTDCSAPAELAPGEAAGEESDE